MTLRGRAAAAAASLLAAAALAGCAPPLRPLGPLSKVLQQAGVNHAPALSDRWLALISGRQGREQVLLIHLQTRRPVPLPGLNRPDAQPVSVSLVYLGRLRVTD